MQRNSLIVFAALIVPVMIWVDKPSAAWVATHSIQLAHQVAALWKALAVLGIVIAFAAILLALPKPADGRSARPARRDGIAALRMLASAAASLGTAGLLKHLIGRVRPSANGADPWLFEPLAFDDRFAALPSAHAACVAAISFSLAMSLPQMRVPLVLGGAVVCLARVLSGAHWPSDVLAGWVLGAAIATGMHVSHARLQRRTALRRM